MRLCVTHLNRPVSLDIRNVILGESLGRASPLDDSEQYQDDGNDQQYMDQATN